MKQEIKRNGYAKFINELFDNNQYIVNDDYYDIENCGWYDKYVFKYNFSSVSAKLINKGNNFYNVAVKYKDNDEVIGEVYAGEKFNDMISQPYKAMVDIEGGKAKKIIYNDDDEPVRFGDEYFHDYEFTLRIIPLD